METIIITGAAGGVGQATVKALSTPERKLICVDLDPDRLAETVNGLDGPAVPIVSDLASPDACADIVAHAGGAVAGLVHLAGTVEYDPVLNDDPGLWDRVINSGLRNAYDLAGAIIPTLAPGKRPAKFVFTSSLAFRRGSPEFIAYGASKGGIAGLVRSLARRLGPLATVNAVAPGIIETPMTVKLMADHGERLRAGITMGRFGQPKDVADVISFLIGPNSDYMTGQILNVDGGMAFD